MVPLACPAWGQGNPGLATSVTGQRSHCGVGKTRLEPEGAWLQGSAFSHYTTFPESEFFFSSIFARHWDLWKWACGYIYFRVYYFGNLFVRNVALDCPTWWFLLLFFLLDSANWDDGEMQKIRKQVSMLQFLEHEFASGAGIPVGKKANREAGWHGGQEPRVWLPGPNA